MDHSTTGVIRYWCYETKKLFITPVVLWSILTSIYIV